MSDHFDADEFVDYDEAKPAEMIAYIVTVNGRADSAWPTMADAERRRGELMTHCVMARIVVSR